MPPLLPLSNLPYTEISSETSAEKKKKELGGFYRCALNYFEPSAFPLFLVFYCALRGSLCSLGLAAAVHQGTIVILKSSVMTAVILWAGFVVVFLVS